MENSLDYACISWRIPWVAIGEILELCLEEVLDVCTEEVRGLCLEEILGLLLADILGISIGTIFGLFLGETLNAFEREIRYKGASLYKEIPLQRNSHCIMKSIIKGNPSPWINVKFTCWFPS